MTSPKTKDRASYDSVGTVLRNLYRTTLRCDGRRIGRRLEMGSFSGDNIQHSQKDDGGYRHLRNADLPYHLGTLPFLPLNTPQLSRFPFSSIHFLQGYRTPSTKTHIWALPSRLWSSVKRHWLWLSANPNRIRLEYCLFSCLVYNLPVSLRCWRDTRRACYKPVGSEWERGRRRGIHICYVRKEPRDGLN